MSEIICLLAKAKAINEKQEVEGKVFQIQLFIINKGKSYTSKLNYLATQIIKMSPE